MKYKDKNFVPHMRYKVNLSSRTIEEIFVSQRLGRYEWLTDKGDRIPSLPYKSRDLAQAKLDAYIAEQEYKLSADYLKQKWTEGLSDRIVRIFSFMRDNISHQEIADRLGGVTKERVRQLCMKANRLKKKALAQGLDFDAIITELIVEQRERDIESRQASQKRFDDQVIAHENWKNKQPTKP
jgi:hypothetical protein